MSVIGLGSGEIVFSDALKNNPNPKDAEIMLAEIFVGVSPLMKRSRIVLTASELKDPGLIASTRYFVKF